MSEILGFLFDMDHTLIDADCDVTWKQYAVRHGLAPADALAQADRFFDDYNAGTLDEAAFMRFQFAEFVGRTEAEMAELCRDHFAEMVLPKVYLRARDRVRQALDTGRPVAILTSTNTMLARPVADWFGIPEVLGTTLELADGRFTGRIVGAYAVGAGKLVPAAAFAARCGGGLRDLAAYGDSINDRFLLEAVGFPTAANPSAALRDLAERRGWPIAGFGAAE